MVPFRQTTKRAGELHPQEAVGSTVPISSQLKSVSVKMEIPMRFYTNRPRPSEGQFFGQVGHEHFVSRGDETKWCAFRAVFCR